MLKQLLKQYLSMVNVKDIMKLVKLLVDAIPYLMPLLEMLLKMKHGNWEEPEVDEASENDEEK